VTWNSHNVLFLPPDRRPNGLGTASAVYAVQGNFLAIGHKSGRLTILGFDLDIDPLSKLLLYLCLLKIFKANMLEDLIIG
jgi:hypothetical protein